MLFQPGYTRVERQSGKENCDHSASQRWLRLRETHVCWVCWRVRFAVLSVVLALIGAILLSVTLFGEVEVNRQPMGIAGVILTMFAIMFAAITG
jgi:steroid 5-alpha reductase family enzyme